MRILQYIRQCPWGDLVPSTMKEKGLGGRETALLQLGENWAKQGHEVINFVPTEKIEKTEYDGGGVVRYLPTKDFVPYCRNFGADVLVSWEEAGVADVPDIVDNVDIIVIEMQVAHLASDPGSDMNIDYYAVLSEWAGAFILDQNNWIHKDKIAVFPNGVDIKRFEANPKSNFGKPEFFYSSSPDRGLVNVLKMWPKIREKYPDAVLHVAYGVDKWVDQLKWSHNLQGEIAVEISDKITQDGIINHGKIGQDELAEIQSRCSVMLYPCETHSPTETGCISVVESAAAGAVPVITDEDCLGTEFCELFPHTNLPFNEDKYLEELFKLLSDEEYYDSCRKNGFELAASRDWSLISEDWIEFFETELIIKIEALSFRDTQRANKEWLEANV